MPLKGEFVTLDFQEPVMDRSRYAPLFAELHNTNNWHRSVLIDVVRGGGLATRLRRRQYRGMQDLEYTVRAERKGPLLRVLVTVTGRRKDDKA